MLSNVRIVCLCLLYTETNIESMENLESRLLEAVQSGQIIKRLFVPFAVRISTDTFVHYMRGIARRGHVSVYDLLIYALLTCVPT